jgi:arylsulfatase A-like enzyme
MTLWIRISGPLKSLLPHAASLALLTGGIEAGIIITRQAVRQFVWSGPDVVWMAPFGYLILSLALAVLLAFIGATVPALGRPRLYVGLVSIVGIAAILRLLTLQRLHAVAIVLLATGLGIQLARWLTPANGRLRLLTRMACWLWIPVAGAVVLVLGLRWWGPSPSTSAQEAQPTGPSIVLIVWDTVRELSMSLYGYDRPTTPALDRWAGQAVVFERAYATSSWTLPSHASLFTGRFPPEMSADWLEPLDETHSTIAEQLAGRGFRTGAFIANLNYMTRETGLARGFQTWDDYPVTVKEILLNTELGQWVTGWRGIIALRGHDRKRADVVTDAFLDWHARQEGEPVFAFLNYKDGHVPYYAPDSLKQRFRRDRPQRDGYDASIAYLDQELDRLLSELDRRGALSRTIVVLTSDHGESFGDHGLIGHGNSLYRQVIHVPLVLIGPGQLPGGFRVTQPVSLRSVPATLMDLTGGDPAVFPGASLARFWQESGSRGQDATILSTLTPAPRTPAAESRNVGGELRSLVIGAYHYILNPDGSEEIFNLESDSLEEQNLAGLASDSLLRAIRADLRVFDSLYPRKKALAPAP